MAPKRPVFSLNAALAEAEAFERLVEGQRRCIEAATEIAVYRSEPQWIRVAQFYEKILAQTQKMQIDAARGVQKRKH